MGVTGDTNFKWGQGVDTWHTYVSISRSKQYAFDGQKKNESIEYRCQRRGLKGKGTSDGALISKNFKAKHYLTIFILL